MKHFSALLLLSAFALQAGDSEAVRDAEALNNQGVHLFNDGRYRDAEESYAKAIAIWRENGSASLAAGLNNLGALYRALGKYAESEAQYLEALQIQTSLFGKDSIQSANVLNNLAQLYRTEGRLKDALPLARKSVALTEEGNPALVDRLATLGSTYADLGQPDEALALFDRAAHLAESTPGVPPRRLAGVLNNMAEVHISQRRFEQAEPLARRAISLWERSVEPGHPNIAVGLNNLAQALRLQGKYAEAEPLYRRSLQILETRLGPDHPDFAKALTNLADFFHERGRDGGAIVLYKRALDVLERSLGPDHPFTTKVRGNLAQVYHAEGRYTEAASLLLLPGEVSRSAAKSR